MKIRCYLRIVGLLGVLVLSLSALQTMAQSREFPPGIEWQQLETEHFIIVFDADYRAAAAKLSAIAEPIYQQVTGLLRYAPTGKTYVVLTDHLDQSNGYASPVPRNKIALYLREPGAGDAFFGLRSPDWLTLVFTHEYTHIVQLDMVDGFYRFLRNVFGRVSLPNSGLPMWMIEGLAVYTETKWQDGRGYHPNYDMMMRTDILENAFKPLDQMAAIGLRKWPMGTIVYLYGYFFTQYLADTYGEDRMVQLSQENSKKLPLIGRNIFKNVYDGKKVKTLWEEWRTAMQQHYEQQIAAIRAKPVTDTRNISASGYYTQTPVFAPDGSWVYYLEGGPHKTFALVQQRLSDGKVTRLREGSFSGNFSVSADGQSLYFCEYEVYKTFAAFSDLYVMDLPTRNVRRLTTGARALDPAISPDGKILVFVTTKGGQTRLMRMDLASKAVTPLLEPTDHTQLAQPAFSADGKRLALQVWKEGGFQDIYVMQSDGSDLHPLTLDRATDSSPSWAMQDRYIMFSSDRTGVPNIFAYDLTDQKLYQVTNVLTGAFNPEVSSDGSQLVLESYSSTGVDIHLATITPEAWQATAYTLETLPTPPQVVVAQTPLPTERRYHAAASLRPTLWIPSIGEDEAGLQISAMTMGSDVLSEHSYTLGVSYGLESKRVSAFGTYTNAQFFPAFTIFGADVANVYGDIFRNDDNKTKTYWQREQTAGISVELPVYESLKSTLSLALGYRYQKISPLTDRAGLTPRPDDGVLSGISTGLFFQNLKGSIYGISPEGGMLASVTYQRDHPDLGSDFDLHTVVGDTRWYWRIPQLQHHVLAFRATGGLSEGDTLSQGIFQVGGSSVTGEPASLSQQNYFLRGYEANALAGNRFALGSVEYRFPIVYPQRGIGPLFFDSLSGAAFYDIGNAWDGDTEFDDFKQGVGGELRINTLVQNVLPLTVYAGYAYGLDNELGKSEFLYGFTFDVGL